MTETIMALDETQAQATIHERLVATSPMEDLIRQRAHEIWLARGSEPGSDVTNWLEAEEELLGRTK